MALVSSRTGTASGGRARERLLDAAEKLFAERGYLAASVREITAAAGCNVAAVNYHFGGKDNLHRETVRRRLAHVRERRLTSLRRALDRAGDAATLELVLRVFIATFLEPLTRREDGGWSMELFSRELLERRLPPQLLLDEFIEPTSTALVEALRQVCPLLDPRAARLCGQSLVGQLIHVARLRRLLDSVPARRSHQLSHPRLVEHIVRFNAAGIRSYLNQEAI